MSSREREGIEGNERGRGGVGVSIRFSRRVGVYIRFFDSLFCFRLSVIV